MRSHETLARPFTAAGFRRGCIAAWPFILSNGLAAMVMGIAYRGLGLGFVPSVLFSIVAYSATAQAVTLGLWTMPPPIAAMMLACGATNARYLVMSAHLRQLFPDMPRRLMLPILATLGDASWLMTVAEAEKGRRDAGYLLGAGVPMVIGWVGGTALGYAMPLQPHGPIAIGAAILPLAFVASLVPTQWRGRRSVMPWALSALVAVLVAQTLGQSWAMLIGGSVGTIASAVRGDDA